MPLSPELADLLACPRTREPLVHVAERGLLYARLARLAYRVEEGLPRLLPEEAREVSEAEAAELEALLG
ncbi:MAG: Trm112 family protein [Deltaproteobacteria bacterium]|nr:Trm112 family protein [Deltaproteobacteria bacterium]